MHAESSVSKFIVLGLACLIFLGFGATVWWGVNRTEDFVRPSSNVMTPASEGSAIAAGTSSSSLPSQNVAEAEETWNGVRFLGVDGSRRMLSELSTAPPSVVLLVHGLDDPGWTWDELIVALQQAGYDVARFDYPNDESVPKAANMFGETLEQMKSAGVSRVSVVAHSMGGLVTRDVLTSKAFYAGDGDSTEALPEIERLIMLGTPNHGSEFARFRGIGEIREQIVRLFSGERDVFRFLNDGKGEAGEDLLPGSEFLNSLNELPLAAHTKYTIVAGRVSPITEEEIHGWIDNVVSKIPTEKLPKWAQRRIKGINGEDMLPFVDDLIGGVGDGVVTLESAKLKGVDDFVIVEGNHLSMIHNVFSSDRVPPAIPFVLERLNADRESRE